MYAGRRDSCILHGWDLWRVKINVWSLLTWGLADVSSLERCPLWWVQRWELVLHVSPSAGHERGPRVHSAEIGRFLFQSQHRNASGKGGQLNGTWTFSARHACHDLIGQFVYMYMVYNTCIYMYFDSIHVHVVLHHVLYLHHCNTCTIMYFNTMYFHTIVIVYLTACSLTACT